MTVTAAPAPAAIPRTTDRYNTALTLQLLRLYADQSTIAAVYLMRAADHPVPTFAAFVQASLRMRN